MEKKVKIKNVLTRLVDGTAAVGASIKKVTQDFDTIPSIVAVEKFIIVKKQHYVVSVKMTKDAKKTKEGKRLYDHVKGYKDLNVGDLVETVSLVCNDENDINKLILPSESSDSRPIPKSAYEVVKVLIVTESCKIPVEFNHEEIVDKLNVDFSGIENVNLPY